MLCAVQVNSLQTANASLRESLRQTRQQLEGGELHAQLETVSRARRGGWLAVTTGVGRLGGVGTVCWVALLKQAYVVGGCGPCTLTSSTLLLLASRLFLS